MNIKTDFNNFYVNLNYPIGKTIIKRCFQINNDLNAPFKI